MASWTTACHWRLQRQRSCWARTTTPPPRSLRSPAHPAQAWMPIFSTSCLMLWRSWVWNGLPQKNRPVAAWMNGYCQRAVSPLDNELHHSSQRFTMRSPSLGVHPTHPVPLLPLPSLRSTAQKKRLRQPASPQRVSGRASLPNSSVQWMSLTRTPQLSVSSATDLALHTTKMTAQAIGRSMPSLVVLARHLWLNLTEMKDVDKIPFLDSPTGLFGPAVEGFAECFTAAQKSSQAIRHFLPKCSSSTATSSLPKMAPTQQPVKAVPPAVLSPAVAGPPLKKCYAS